MSVHSALAPAEVEKEVGLEGLEGWCPGIQPRSWQPAKGIPVSVGCIRESALPVEGVTIVEQFVQKDQEDLRLALGHQPGCRTQLGALPQESGHNGGTAVGDHSVKNPDSSHVLLLHVGSTLEQQFCKLFSSLVDG